MDHKHGFTPSRYSPLVMYGQVAFVADDLQIVAGLSDGNLQVSHGVPGAKPFIMAGHSRVVYDLCLSPDGKWIVSCSVNNKIQIWDTLASAKGTQQSPVVTLEKHTRDVNSVAFSPDGRWLASGSADETIRIWDVSSWTHMTTVQTVGPVRSLAFSPDGTRLVSGMAIKESNVQLWDTASWSLLMNLEGHSDDVFAVAFSPDAERIASGSRDKIWHSTSSVQVGDAPKSPSV